MKSKVYLTISIIVTITLITIVYFCFVSIEKENIPYFSNKEKFMDVFNKNSDLFESLVKQAEQIDGNILFQYNSTLGKEQILNEFGENDFSETVCKIINECGITNIQKYSDSMLIYQYAPIVASDVKIGIKYDYSTSKWSFYYHHDYDNCRHKYPMFYRVYDSFFN